MDMGNLAVHKELNSCLHFFLSLPFLLSVLSFHFIEIHDTTNRPRRPIFLFFLFTWWSDEMRPTISTLPYSK